jgi:hypothetical protein
VDKIKHTISSYLMQIGSYFKDNFLLIIKPGTYVEKISTKAISIKVFILNLLLITLIHSIFNYLLVLGEWNFVNTLGLSWQICIFAVFVISFCPLIIDSLSSKISKAESKLYPLSKVYFHILLIFALYPIVNIILHLLNQPYNFYLPFSYGATITWGQIIEAILISYISIFVIYYFYKSKKAVILSLIIIGISFPLLLYGLDFKEFLRWGVYGFQTYGLMNDAAHFILWCLENMWFCLLILFFGLFYFIYRKKNPLKSIPKIQIIPNLFFPSLVLLGYFFGGCILPLPQLISLLIASVAAWNFVFLLYMYHMSINKKPNNCPLNKWEFFMSGFWLVTIALSFSLIVSFISGLFCLLFWIFSFIFIKIKINSSNKLIQIFILFISFFLIFLMGSIPTFFFLFHFLPSIIAIDWPTLYSCLVAIPISLIPSIFFKLSYFFPHFPEEISK